MRLCLRKKRKIAEREMRKGGREEEKEKEEERNLSDEYKLNFPFCLELAYLSPPSLMRLAHLFLEKVKKFLKIYKIYNAYET